MTGKTRVFLNSISCKMIFGLLLLFLVALALSFISINLSVLIFFGFLPTIIAIAIDNYKGKVLLRIIVLFNILGSLSFLIRILLNIQEVQQISYTIVFMPNTWLIIYSSCIFGWGLYLLVPKIAYYLVYTEKTDLLRKLKDNFENICQEWGEENIQITIAQNDIAFEKKE